MLATAYIPRASAFDGLRRVVENRASDWRQNGGGLHCDLWLRPDGSGAGRGDRANFAGRSDVRNRIGTLLRVLYRIRQTGSEKLRSTHHDYVYVSDLGRRLADDPPAVEDRLGRHRLFDVGVLHLSGRRGDDLAVRALFGQPPISGSQSKFPDLDARTRRRHFGRMAMARREDGADADRRRRGSCRRRSVVAVRKPDAAEKRRDGETAEMESGRAGERENGRQMIDRSLVSRSPALPLSLPLRALNPFRSSDRS